MDHIERNVNPVAFLNKKKEHHLYEGHINNGLQDVYAVVNLQKICHKLA